MLPTLESKAYLKRYPDANFCMCIGDKTCRTLLAFSDKSRQLTTSPDERNRKGAIVSPL